MYPYYPNIQVVQMLKISRVTKFKRLIKAHIHRDFEAVIFINIKKFLQFTTFLLSKAQIQSLRIYSIKYIDK